MKFFVCDDEEKVIRELAKEALLKRKSRNKTSRKFYSEVTICRHALKAAQSSKSQHSSKKLSEKI